MNPKAIGEISEAMVLAALLRAGKVVLQPFGDNQRYDLVLDEDGAFVRVQCKTARLREGILEFSTCSTSGGGAKRNYRGQIEVFGVYSPDLDRVYLVPVEDVGVSNARLRLEPARNGQKQRVRLAGDYELTSAMGT